MFVLGVEIFLFFNFPREVQWMISVFVIYDTVVTAVLTCDPYTFTEEATEN